MSETVTYDPSRYGAKAAYTTYEADQGTLSAGATVKKASSIHSTAHEASKQSYVDLPVNAAVSFTAKADADAATLRYTVPDGATGKVEIQVNGKPVANLDLSSKHNWQYLENYEHHKGEDIKIHDTPAADRVARFQFDEAGTLLKNTSIQSGDTVTIVNQSGNTPVGIDFVELEKTPAAIKQPANSVSITDFGAKANDGIDDSKALTEAIESAKTSGKSVYIPEGQFDFDHQLHIYAPKGISIGGAGRWHTKLHFTSEEPPVFENGTVKKGGGIVFEHGSNNIDFGNLSMDSNLTSRFHQQANYKGISGTLGKGSSIHDITIEHFEVGIWTGDYAKVDNEHPLHYTDGLTVSNALIRNNLADGINFAQGTSHSTVINSNIRGNGDDGLATWSSIADQTESKVAENNRFLNNTVELGWRAAGIGIFGGAGHEVAGNLIRDNAAWSGIRLNTVFQGHNFDLNKKGISVRDNLLIGNGTRTDTYGREKGSIDFEEEHGAIKNVKVENNIIADNLSDTAITKTLPISNGKGIALSGNNIIGNAAVSAPSAVDHPEKVTSITRQELSNIPDQNYYYANETAGFKSVSVTYITGTTGSDSIKGTDGIDHIDGKSGDDNIYAGGGNDTVFVSGGTNFISGGDGDDIVRGGDGRDTVNGDSGNDVIFGNGGDDHLNGGAGNDTLFGGENNDVFYGESGKDVLYGGSGDDLLFGGLDDDILYGGAGNDTYVFCFGEGHDTISDNHGNNALQFGQGIAVKDLHIHASTDASGAIDWEITIANSGGKITIDNQYLKGSNTASVGEFRLDEGTFTVETLLDKLSASGQTSGFETVNNGVGSFNYTADTANVQHYDAVTQPTIL